MLEALPSRSTAKPSGLAENRAVGQPVTVKDCPIETLAPATSKMLAVPLPVPHRSGIFAMVLGAARGAPPSIWSDWLSQCSEARSSDTSALPPPVEDRSMCVRSGTLRLGSTGPLPDVGTSIGNVLGGKPQNETGVVEQKLTVRSHLTASPAGGGLTLTTFEMPKVPVKLPFRNMLPCTDPRAFPCPPPQSVKSGDVQGPPPAIRRLFGSQADGVRIGGPVPPLEKKSTVAWSSHRFSSPLWFVELLSRVRSVENGAAA